MILAGIMVFCSSKAGLEGYGYGGTRRNTSASTQPEYQCRAVADRKLSQVLIHAANGLILQDQAWQEWVGESEVGTQLRTICFDGIITRRST